MRSIARRRLNSAGLLIILAGLLALGRHCLRSQQRSQAILDIVHDPASITNTTQPGRPRYEGIAEIAPPMLQQMIGDRTAIVVDARLRRLFREGHIPGAVNVPALRPDNATMKAVLGYPRTVTVVVYCESAECVDSKTVGERLQQEGMSDVRILAGGIEQWKAHGFRLAAEP